MESVFFCFIFAEVKIEYMEVINKVFVPKEIAKQLKEIYFDEPCMAFYQDYEGFDNLYVNNFETDENVSVLTDTIFVGNHNIGENEISTPTWEQVFKWFRDRGFYSEILFKSLGIGGNIITFDEEGLEENCHLELQETYEQAQKNLALELIELYKNGQRPNKK